MGYWILIAMLACALIAVVVAISLGGGRLRPPDHRRGDTLSWLAVVGEHLRPRGDSWADRLAAVLPESVTSRVVAVDGETLMEQARSVGRAMDESSPDVVLFWTALDDVLTGVPLDEHERTLNALLEEIDERGAVAVTGNVPDLARLPGAAEAGLPAEELRLLTERWNGAIARLAHHHGALVADLFDLMAENRRIGRDDRNGNGAADLLDRGAIAERFLPVLRQALVSARRRRAAAPVEEPV